MQGSAGGREALPKIEADMRELERTVRSSTIQLDRNDCWDQFLFSKTLRRTPRCIQLNADVENGRQRLADLDRQRRQIMGTGERSLVPGRHHPRACAQRLRPAIRAGGAQARCFAAIHSPCCSAARKARAPRGPTNQFGNLPFATYRTLCVRLCDGYYFPVSFSTLPNHFQRDAQLCQSQCAAPAELYYHQNPGGAVEQALSVEQPAAVHEPESRRSAIARNSCRAARASRRSTSPRLTRRPSAAPVPNVTGAKGVRLGAKSNPQVQEIAGGPARGRKMGK